MKEITRFAMRALYSSVPFSMTYGIELRMA